MTLYITKEPNFTRFHNQLFDFYQGYRRGDVISISSSGDKLHYRTRTVIDRIKSLFSFGCYSKLPTKQIVDEVIINYLKCNTVYLKEGLDANHQFIDDRIHTIAENLSLKYRLQQVEARSDYQAESMKRLYHTRENGDLILIAMGGMEFKIHRFLLSSLRYFSNESRPFFNVEEKIDFSDSWSEVVISRFSDYLYGVELKPLSQKQMIEFYYFSSFIGSEYLEKETFQSLFSNLKEDTLEPFFDVVLSLQDFNPWMQEIRKFIKVLKKASSDLQECFKEKLKMLENQNQDGAYCYLKAKFLGGQLEVAVEKKQALAMTDLGDSLYRIDQKRAVELYQQAAEIGDLDAQINYGCYLINRYSNKENDQKAFFLFHQAARKGDLKGIYNLGFCFSHSRGVPRNLEKAFNCYLLAAEKGLMIAQNNVATLYEKGVGVRSDLGLAVYWYNRAAAQGCQKAKKSLQRFGILL